MKNVDDVLKKYELELYDAEEYIEGVITYRYRNSDNSIRAIVVNGEIKLFSNESLP